MNILRKHQFQQEYIFLQQAHQHPQKLPPQPQQKYQSKKLPQILKFQRTKKPQNSTSGNFSLGGYKLNV